MKHFNIKLMSIAAWLLFSACDSFDPGYLIEDTRVLGARVEVEGEPARASPEPGESVQITWITASPTGQPTFSWAFVACIQSQAGLAKCAEDPVALTQGKGAVPGLRLTVPSKRALADADTIQVLGVICEGGSPAFAEDGTTTCEGKSKKTHRVQLDVQVSRDAQANLNPVLGDARLELDGETWKADTADVSEGECRSNEELPQVKANGHTVKVALELGAKAREVYLDRKGRRVPETLQISHFVTDGELEGQFSFVESKDPATRPKVVLDWDAPDAKSVPDEGEVVRFVFVVRDLRGGVAVTERALCAVP